MTVTEVRTSFKTLKLNLPVGHISVPQEPMRVGGGDFDNHVIFDWNSMGGPFTLCEMKIHDGISIAATHSEFDGYMLVALIEPDVPELWAAYYRQVFLTNGAAYGFGLFGSLPLHIVNDEPDLLTDDLIRGAMWDNFRMLWSDDPEMIQNSISEVIERMRPVEQGCVLELLDDVRQYPHREDNRGGDGTSRLELRWLFDWYWQQVYSRNR